MSTLNVNNINEAGGVDAVITSGVLDSGSLPAGSILQVVSTTKTDTFSTTSTSFTPLTGLSATITPTSTSSKIYIVVNIYFSASTGNVGSVQLKRDATVIGGGTAVGSRPSLSIYTRPGTQAQQSSTITQFLDSPNSTSSITYSLDLLTSSGTLYVNQRADDSDSTNSGRLSSTITLMEVAA